MLDLRNTIHEPEKIYATAGNPMLVLCDDFQNYVCKHSRHSSKLVNEIVGSFFADCWDLPTPEICLINVEKDHVPKNLQGVNFNKPCFGSKYIESSKEIDATTLSMFDDPSFRRKIANRNDFLMIALFDIWLSNEDRNHNNSNLLMDFSANSQIYFTVFDHDSIFNSNALHRGVYQINDFDSLIYTELANKLFTRGQSLVNVVDNLVKKFYICVNLCENNIDALMALIPVQWGININDYKGQLTNNLFTTEWLIECENNFRALIQANIK